MNTRDPKLETRRWGKVFLGSRSKHTAVRESLILQKSLTNSYSDSCGWVSLRRLRRRVLLASLASGLLFPILTVGCSKTKPFKAGAIPSTSSAAGYLSQLERSDAVTSDCMPEYRESIGPMELDVTALTPERLRAMSLQDCIAYAVSNSKLMRDLGVTVLRSPEALTTTLDPAVVYTDPRIGEEAALSAFDANFFASTAFDYNNRGYNNNFFGRNGLFRQDLSTTQLGLSKRTATGAQYTLRDVTVFDRNNQQSNRLGPYTWDTFLEAQVRQPMMLGAGTDFNRIAGPGALPGQLNGVLLARVRTDISLVDFERSVRDFVADVENAYWDLYFSYRDLEAKTEARNKAYVTYESIKARDQQGVVGNSQALEQFWRFEADVVDSLNGRTVDGTRTNNGSTGGSFRGTGGLRVCERRLRLLMGMPINDAQLIHPTDQPSLALVDFDWETSISEAMTRREELRRQRWVIKQRELELIANRNFLKPQFDAIAAYRIRGFDSQFNTPLDNDFQEWSLGLDYLKPIGYRRGNAAVRNTQLSLARESQILLEQERAVHFGLSNAINESYRAYRNLEIQKQRLEAVVEQINALKERMKEARVEQVFVLLEAQRRGLDALIRYHQSAVEYQLAVRNVHLERGTLLPYCKVFLNESASSDFVVNDGVTKLRMHDSQGSAPARDPVIGRASPAYSVPSTNRLPEQQQIRSLNEQTVISEVPMQTPSSQIAPPETAAPDLFVPQARDVTPGVGLPGNALKTGFE